MVGIQSIGEVPELANPVLTGSRAVTQKQNAYGDTPRDELDVSPQAQQTAQALGAFKETEAEKQQREERITEIRDSLEKGTHRLQQVLLQVASRISGYVSDAGGTPSTSNTGNITETAA